MVALELAPTSAGFEQDLRASLHTVAGNGVPAIDRSSFLAFQELDADNAEALLAEHGIPLQDDAAVRVFTSEPAPAQSSRSLAESRTR
jgi:hypothetical protein